MDPKADAKRRRDQGTITKVEPTETIEAPIYVSHPHHAALLQDLLVTVSLEIRDIKNRKANGSPLTQEEKVTIVKFGELALKAMKTEVDLESKEVANREAIGVKDLLEAAEVARRVLESNTVDYDDEDS